MMHTELNYDSELEGLLIYYKTNYEEELTDDKPKIDLYVCGINPQEIISLSCHPTYSTSWKRTVVNKFQVNIMSDNVLITCRNCIICVTFSQILFTIGAEL